MTTLSAIIRVSLQILFFNQGRTIVSDLRHSNSEVDLAAIATAAALANSSLTENQLPRIFGYLTDPGRQIALIVQLCHQITSPVRRDRSK